MAEYRFPLRVVPLREPHYLHIVPYYCGANFGIEHGFNLTIGVGFELACGGWQSDMTVNRDWPTNIVLPNTKTGGTAGLYAAELELHRQLKDDSSELRAYIAQLAPCLEIVPMLEAWLKAHDKPKRSFTVFYRLGAECRTERHVIVQSLTPRAAVQLARNRIEGSRIHYVQA